MKAVRLYSYQGTDGLQVDEIERPFAGAGELLIEVKAIGINPVDWKIAEGFGQDLFGHLLPQTLGCEVSGVISQVGPSVAEFAAGDEVFGFVGLDRCGGFAEYVVGKISEFAKKPTNLDHPHAAALPVGALTAWQAMFDYAGLKEGQTILIHAAAGGVGSLAVQLAKAHGAFVIGTASEANEEFVRSLGADEFVDYRNTQFETVVRNVDVVLDTIGGQTQDRSFQVLKHDGALMSVVEPPSGPLAQRYQVNVDFVAVQPNNMQLVEVTKLAEAGKLNSYIAKTFPLSETAAALALNREGRTRGKIVVIPE